MAKTTPKGGQMFHQVVMRKATNKQFYFTFHATNGEELVRSSETYKAKQSAEKALRSIMRIFGCTSIIINDQTTNEAKCIHSS